MADDDGPVVVDLFDDGHVPVGRAAAVHAGPEADGVAGTWASPDAHAEASGLVGPEAAVAHVRVDGFADLPAADERPPGALEPLVCGRRLVGAGGFDVDVVAVRVHHQRRAESADGRALVDVAALTSAGHAVHILQVFLRGLRDIGVSHEIALAGVVCDDQRVLIRELGEGGIGVRGLEGLDALHAVLQVDAAVVGVGHGVGDAFGRCPVGALRVHAAPHAAVHLHQAPCAAVAVIGIRVGSEPALLAHDRSDQGLVQPAAGGGLVDPRLGLVGDLHAAVPAGGGGGGRHQQGEHERGDHGDGEHPG